MKKLLLGSIVMMMFSASVILFQLSCQKSVQAQSSSYTLPPATPASLGGVIVGSGLSVTSNGTISVLPNTPGLTQLNKLIFKKNIGGGSSEVWTANYDGSNAGKVAITLPAGVSFSDDMNPVLSPDGQKIFFTAGATGTSGGDLYSCNSNGSNVTKIVEKGGSDDNIILGAAY
jgi:hypothetical protein